MQVNTVTDPGLHLLWVASQGLEKMCLFPTFSEDWSSFLTALLSLPPSSSKITSASEQCSISFIFPFGSITLSSLVGSPWQLQKKRLNPELSRGWVLVFSHVALYRGASWSTRAAFPLHSAFMAHIHNGRLISMSVLSAFIPWIIALWGTILKAAAVYIRVPLRCLMLLRFKALKCKVIFAYFPPSLWSKVLVYQ